MSINDLNVAQFRNKNLYHKLYTFHIFGMTRSSLNPLLTTMIDPNSLLTYYCTNYSWRDHKSIRIYANLPLKDRFSIWNHQFQKFLNDDQKFNRFNFNSVRYSSTCRPSYETCETFFGTGRTRYCNWPGYDEAELGKLNGK